MWRWIVCTEVGGAVTVARCRVAPYDGKGHTGDQLYTVSEPKGLVVGVTSAKWLFERRDEAERRAPLMVLGR